MTYFALALFIITVIVLVNTGLVLDVGALHLSSAVATEVVT